MEVEKLLKEQEEKINELEKMLSQYSNIDYILEEELINITKETDADGGNVFSNEIKRKDELKKRCGKHYDKKEKLKIDIEIQRLRIGLLSDRIRFYSK